MVNHYEKVYHNGKLVSKTKVSQQVERRTKDKIIAVGTKKVEKPVVVQAAATQVKATPAKLSGTKKVTAAKAVQNNVVRT